MIYNFYDFDLETKKKICYFIWYINIILIMFLVYNYLLPKILYHLYRFIFNYKALKINNYNLFTTEKDILSFIDNKFSNDKGVYFLLIPKNLNDTVQNDNIGYEKIKEYYFKFLFFWYCNEYDAIKFRKNISILPFIFSFLFFIFISTVLKDANFNISIKLFLFTVFIMILYYIMLQNINTFLDPHYYKREINQAFKNHNISFYKDTKRYSQKIMLYLNRNFTFLIYDKKLDRIINIESSKKFEKFILKSTLDRSGRDNIINIFVMAFLIIYITIFIKLI